MVDNESDDHVAVLDQASSFKIQVIHPVRRTDQQMLWQFQVTTCIYVLYLE